MWLVKQIDVHFHTCDSCVCVCVCVRVHASAFVCNVHVFSMCAMCGSSPSPSNPYGGAGHRDAFTVVAQICRIYTYIFYYFLCRKLRCMNDNDIGNSSARITRHQFCTHLTIYLCSERNPARCRFAHLFFSLSLFCIGFSFISGGLRRRATKTHFKIHK